MKIVARTKKLFMLPVADLRGDRGDAPPPGPKFFQFHAVFGKIGQNRMLAPPPEELAPPPRGNPGSATGYFLWNFLYYSIYLS